MRYRCLLTTLMVFAVCFVGNAALLAGPQPGEQPRGETERREAKKPDTPAPKPGEAAPPFILKTLEGNNEVNLTSLLKERPVMLLFGSYT